LEAELLVQADRLVGGKGAVLVIDDTAMPKKGDRSVGVAPQYASSLGKTANCQTLVSLTLAQGEVPVMKCRMPRKAWQRTDDAQS
jgi:SRSO17 transposase